MFQRIGQGFASPLSSLSYLTENKLWKYMWLPLLLTVAALFVLGLVFWLLFFSGPSKPVLDIADWPTFVQWIIMALQFVIKIVVLVLLFSLILRIYLALFSIVVIPFLSPLVEKILQIEGMTTLKLGTLALVGYIVASLWYNIKMFFLQLIVAFLLLFTGPLQPFLNFWASSYFIGRSYFDYVFEMLGRPKEFAQMAKSYRSEAVGLGMFSTVAFFIPVVGTILVPLLSVVAATRLFVAKTGK